MGGLQCVGTGAIYVASVKVKASLLACQQVALLRVAIFDKLCQIVTSRFAPGLL